MTALPDIVLLFKAIRKTKTSNNLYYFGLNPETNANGKSYTDLLLNFKDSLEGLPEPKSPLPTYFKKMTIHDRAVWKCLYPVAASLAKTENRTTAYGIELLKKAREWAIATVELIIDSRIA